MPESQNSAVREVPQRWPLLGNGSVIRSLKPWVSVHYNWAHSCPLYMTSCRITDKTLPQTVSMLLAYFPCVSLCLSTIYHNIQLWENLWYEGTNISNATVAIQLLRIPACSELKRLPIEWVTGVCSKAETRIFLWASLSLLTNGYQNALF